MNETCIKHALNMPDIGGCPYCEIDRLNKEINRLRQYEDAITSAIDDTLLVWNLISTNHTVIKNDYWQNHLEEIDRLEAELESKDKAIKLLQGHCNALMDTEGKLAQWKKGHTAGQEAAGYYQKQADDIIRQLRKELSDENANFTEEIMNLERQLSEARAEVERLSSPDYYACALCLDVKEARQEAAREIIQYIVDQGVIDAGTIARPMLVYEIAECDITELKKRFVL